MRSPDRDSQITSRLFGMRRTRTVSHTVIGDFLRRTVELADGTRYLHNCSRAVYEAVAYAMEDAKSHTAPELARTLNEPFTQVDVAFQFMKDRRIIATGHRRRGHAASRCVYEDAMVEFLALRQKNEQDERAAAT